MLVACSCVRGSSAARVTAVMPMAPYSRQDKKEKARICIGASLSARLLETAGVDRAVTVDLHSSQIQGLWCQHGWACGVRMTNRLLCTLLGFFSKPLENLYTEDYLVKVSGYCNPIAGCPCFCLSRGLSFFKLPSTSKPLVYCRRSEKWQALKRPITSWWVSRS